MSGWDNFFMAQVGASAALAGLIFVGVSINLAEILAAPLLPDYALEALVVLLTVLIVSTLSLVPGQPPAIFGGEILVVGFAGWALVSARRRHNLRQVKPPYRRAFAANAVLEQVATLPFVGAGAAVLFRGDGGLYWVIPGVVFSFLVAFYNAWVLLIEIKR